MIFTANFGLEPLDDDQKHQQTDQADGRGDQVMVLFPDFDENIQSERDRGDYQ